jgi:hypothetical protein
MDNDAAPGESDIPDTNTLCSFFCCSTHSPLNHHFDYFSIEQLLDSELPSILTLSFMKIPENTSTSVQIATDFVNTISPSTLPTLISNDLSSKCESIHARHEKVTDTGSSKIINPGLSSSRIPIVSHTFSSQTKPSNGPLHNETYYIPTYMSVALYIQNQLLV